MFSTSKTTIEISQFTKALFENAHKGLVIILSQPIKENLVWEYE